MGYDIPADHHGGLPAEPGKQPEEHTVVFYHSSGLSHSVSKTSAANAESEVSSARDGGGVWVTTERMPSTRHFWPWHMIVDVAILRTR